MKAALDIIIRLEDSTDLPPCERLLFTLLGQRAGLPTEIHLMLTRFSHAAVHELRGRVNRLRSLDPATRILFHNWTEPSPLDVRVPLLNWGLALAGARYLMVLEPFDLLNGGAVARLLDQLGGQAALALAGMQEEDVLWWGETFLPQGERRDCADPLFMIDRDQLRPQSLVLPAGPAGEVGRLIALIGAAHRVNAEDRHSVMAVRQCPA